MGIVSLLVLSVALAMDAFSIAVTDGMIIKDLKFRNAIKIAFYFGMFQAIMPCIGWALGLGLSKYIEEFDHWVAFILLSLIGGKMLFESLRNDDEQEKPKKDPLDNKVLFFLAIATSIDALAVGVTLATIDAPIVISAIVIGIVTFVLSVLGVYMGKSCGNLLGKKAEIVGGAVLVLIGFKILIEHLFS